jgi:hypothetical protein
VLVLPTMTRQVHLNIVKKNDWNHPILKVESDKRPVGARRPRYAASGDVACPGEGEGGSEFEPVDDPMEMSGEEVRLLVNASLYDWARPRGSDALPAPALPPTPAPALTRLLLPAGVVVEKASWRCGVICIYLYLYT